MERKQFTFYRSFYESAQKLKNNRDRLSLYDAIIFYALNGKETNLTPAAEALFTLIKPMLDAANKKAAARARSGEDSRKTS